MNSVLVVDDDKSVAGFIATNLRLEGFDVRLAHDGDDALDEVQRDAPDLVLLDWGMPRMDGIEVCERMRADPHTAHIPVLLVTGRSRAVDKVMGLAAGADDYIVKPFDPLELIARVRATLRRNAEMRAVSPLTGLPGNYRIDQEIGDRVTAGEPFAVCHFDLDNFKSFNDAYGFLRGDQVIALVAWALRVAVAESEPPPPFVGHVGGDDFVMVCRPEQAEPACNKVIDMFDEQVPALHDPADAARGSLEVVDRKGVHRQYPLTSISIGIAMTGRKQYRDRREVVAIAAEMKSVAKQTEGSSIAIDRRTS
ncbi:MAG: response regulator receiver modulated diguanylate cyclase [Frankiales bacterium]|nr:response regulator receiver modulated diguanylate cyclase [Frankiales bacterium]